MFWSFKLIDGATFLFFLWKIFTPDQKCGPTALFTPLITSHDSCSFLRSTFVPSVAFSRVNTMSSLPNLTICSSWASSKHSPYPFLMHCSACPMLSQNKVSLAMLSFHILWETYTFQKKGEKSYLNVVNVLRCCCCCAENQDISIYQEQTTIFCSFNISISLRRSGKVYAPFPPCRSQSHEKLWAAERGCTSLLITHLHSDQQLWSAEGRGRPSPLNLFKSENLRPDNDQTMNIVQEMQTTAAVFQFNPIDQHLYCHQ